MPRTLETKSCRPCAKAKRKCGKQSPRCSRCERRGVNCTYPPTKPSSFVLCEGGELLLLHDSLRLCSSPKLHSNRLSIQHIQATDKSLNPNPLIYDQFVSRWFTSANTWEIMRIPQTDYISFSVADLKRYISPIRDWFTDWIKTGTNAFIHPELYRNRYPRSVQDAYTSLSCYIHKTHSNSEMILQTIEARANQLLIENGICPSSMDDKPILNPSNLDPFDHLSRVQCLMVYQLIGLYDGDIRLRRIAESRIPLLESWMQQMIEYARQAVCLDDFLISSNSRGKDPTLAALDANHDQDRLWHSWVLVESIRRTWLVGSSIQALYLSLYSGKVLPCRGSMMSTTRKGAWEARCTLSWEKMCMEEPFGLMQMADFDKLFIHSLPADVNDFAMVFLEILYGEEMIATWRSKPSHGG